MEYLSKARRRQVRASFADDHLAALGRRLLLALSSRPLRLPGQIPQPVLPLLEDLHGRGWQLRLRGPRNFVLWRGGGRPVGGRPRLILPDRPRGATEIDWAILLLHETLLHLEAVERDGSPPAMSQDRLLARCGTIARILWQSDSAAPVCLERLRRAEWSLIEEACGLARGSAAGATWLLPPHIRGP